MKKQKKAVFLTYIITFLNSLAFAQYELGFVISDESSNRPIIKSIRPDFNRLVFSSAKKISITDERGSALNSFNAPKNQEFIDLEFLSKKRFVALAYSSQTEEAFLYEVNLDSSQPALKTVFGPANVKNKYNVYLRRGAKDVFLLRHELSYLKVWRVSSRKQPAITTPILSVKAIEGSVQVANSPIKEAILFYMETESKLQAVNSMGQKVWQLKELKDVRREKYLIDQNYAFFSKKSDSAVIAIPLANPSKGFEIKVPFGSKSIAIGRVSGGIGGLLVLGRNITGRVKDKLYFFPLLDDNRAISTWEKELGNIRDYTFKNEVLFTSGVTPEHRVLTAWSIRPFNARELHTDTLPIYDEEYYTALNFPSSYRSETTTYFARVSKGKSLIRWYEFGKSDRLPVNTGQIDLFLRKDLSKNRRQFADTIDRIKKRLGSTIELTERSFDERRIRVKMGIGSLGHIREFFERYETVKEKK